MPPAVAEQFAEWQRGVREAAAGCPGYLGTDVYPPVDGQSNEWITILHFADHDALDHWINSDERKAWISKLPVEVGKFEVKPFGAGFGPWFERAALMEAPIPAWKMALTVCLSLFPTLMLLNIFVLPELERMGYSYSRLVGNAISVALLQWLVVPTAKVPLHRWLAANRPEDRLFSWSVAAGLVLGLIALASGFRLFVG